MSALTAPPPVSSGTAGRAQRRPPRPRAVDALAAAAGLGLGITLALGINAETAGSLAAPGGVATFMGRMAGLAAAYAMLVVVLLVARIPVLERVIGQDRLVRWHRRLGPWPLYLLVPHGVLIAIGYGRAARTGALHELGVLLWSYPGVLAATVGSILLVLAGVTSYRIARRRMSYETWWVVHLYVYLALGLSFSHQVATGASFFGHPMARLWWTSLWVATAGLVALHRIAIPLARTLRHRIHVIAVHEEAPGVVSVVLGGRSLDRLALDGGQFFQWRFLTRGLWWQAHPYSLSSLATADRMRVTVKDLGDHSRSLTRLRPGTHVAIEGPYGAFTRHARKAAKVALVGAGVGVTPLRALLEDLPAETDVVMISRASQASELVLAHELFDLVEARGGRLYELVGSRHEVNLGSSALERLVPDLRERDLFVCGPEGFTDRIIRAAHALGVPRAHIHREAFTF